MVHSVLVKHANIIDTASGEICRRDIFIRDGRIEQISCEIAERAQYTIEAEGLWATAGLVDVHSHLYYDSALLGVDPQKYHLPNGVTYCIDQGSAGADNYSDFRERVLASTDAGVRSFLNGSKLGMPVSSLADTGEVPGPGELFREEYFDQDSFTEVYQKYAEELLGIKVRLTPNICPENPRKALKKAVAIAERLGVRISVHANNAAGLQTADVLDVLRKGDIFTHTYHDGDTGILGQDGEIKECALRARERGVIFDTGHGVNSLSFEVMKQAVKKGFLPDTISTDLHNLNINGPVFDLPTTVSKFLCCGVPFHEALRRCILTPVKLLNLQDKSVDLRTGARADIAIFERKEGNFTYTDAMKTQLQGKYKLEARYTILGHKLFVK